MIVPQFWAEARIQERVAGRQITVRRFGWSDTSQHDAQQRAETRAREACNRIAAGEVLERLEPRVAYNGADGVPICEEILSRHGDTIITRNAYGARCLNTPNVLFADIDFASEPRVRGSGFIFITLLIAASALGWMQGSWVVGVVALVLGLLIVSGLLRWLLRKPDNAEQRGLERIDQFVAEHPGWHLRLYRTPAGLRALAMQRTFDPTEPAVEECFKALAVDQVYVYMCRNQRCFRARLSSKPWRIGITAHIRPRTRAWPIKPEQMPARAQWIERYEQVAQGYAACRFLKAVGNTAALDPAALAVQQLHDDLTRSASPLPLA